MDRIKNFAKQITVEPVLFLYMVATWLNFPTFQGLYFLKVCLTQFNDTNFCENEIDNGSYKEEERLIHGKTSQWVFYDTLCIMLPSLIMAPYFGSWSDKISRRIPLLLPPIGAILGCVNYIMCSLYVDLPIGFVLISPLLNGLTGGFITTILGVFSYIGAISNHENRNVRISILESMSFLGGTVGLGVSGVLLNRYGFSVLFGIVMCFHVCIVLYVSLIVPHVPVSDTRDPDINRCTYLFGMGHVKNYIVCALKSRANHGRRNLLLVCLSLFIIFFCFAGTRDITYLFLKKSPISWSRSMYGYYQAYQNTVYFAMLFFITPLLKKFLVLSDPFLVICGLISTMISLLMLGFSTRTWMVFLVPVLGMFHGYAAASSRALASQFVTKDEQGRVFAFIGSIETVASLVASGLFNYLLYPASLSFFAGLSFLVMTCTLFISLSSVGFVYYSIRLADYPYVGFDTEVAGQTETLSVTETPAVVDAAETT